MKKLLHWQPEEPESADRYAMVVERRDINPRYVAPIYAILDVETFDEVRESFRAFKNSIIKNEKKYYIRIYEKELVKTISGNDYKQLLLVHEEQVFL
jgi:hypothetical protein